MHNLTKLGAVLLSLCLFLAGCGPLAAFQSPTESPPVELTYISLVDEEEQSDPELRLLEQFEADHPRITISRQSYSQSPEAYLNTSPPPDVMLALANYDTLSAIESQAVLDLGDVWAAENLAAVYPTGLQSLGRYQGRPHFAPLGYTWIAVYYNKQLFEQYDLPIPQAWDQFLTVSERLWFEGVTPLALAGNDGWSLTMWFDYLTVRLHGPEFHRDLTQGQVPYDDYRVREVFDIWRDLLVSDLFGDRFFTLGLLPSINEVVEGKAAMILASPTMMQEAPKNWQGQLGFFRFPVLDQDVPTCEFVATFGYIIPAGALHPLEASRFVQYLVSAEAQTAFFEQLDGNGEIVPARLDAGSSLLGENAGQGLSLIQRADEVGQPFVFAVPEPMIRDLVLTLRQFLRNPDDLDATLASLETGRQKAYR